MHKLRHAWGIALLLAACGGNAKPAEDPSDVSSERGPAEPDPEPIPDEPAEGADFDEEAAQIVLKRGERKAQQCPAVVADTPTGEGEIDVVFDGPKGRSVDAKLGGIFAGGSEQAQNCIKNAFIGEIIPPFTGTRTVTYSLTIPEPKK